MENHAAIPAVVQHLAERIAARITQMLRAQEGVAERQARRNAVITHQRQHIPRARLPRPDAPAAPQAVRRCSVNRADVAPIIEIFRMVSVERQNRQYSS